ncbi:hypothetical protein Hanom_Chr11g00975331 [Helianthus anomalus]
MVVVDKPTLLGFWDVVVEKDTWDHTLSKGRVSAIIDLLRRLVASSITACGKSREWCTSRDLFFFYWLLYKRSCALAHRLAQYFTSACHRQENEKLYDGACFTVIARTFGYHMDGDPQLLPVKEPKRLGMKIIKKFPVLGKRFYNKDGDIHVPVQLPAHFELFYPPVLPEGVQKHATDMDIAELSQTRPPLRAPQFPHHVVPGPAPGAALY